jgi:hypothetical protein
MIYEIKTYELTGKTIRLAKERPDLKAVSGEHGARDRIVDVDGVDANFGPLTKLTENLGTAKDILSADEFPMFLPYFADVTQDLPGRCKFEPDTYKNCQLMTETHGPYLQFFDHDTEKVLRIAINSNIYNPVK